MTTRPRRFRTGFVAGLAAFALIAGACGGDDGDAATTAPPTDTATPGPDDLSGRTVTLLGPEVGAEADGVTEAFEAFESSTGINIQYTGTRDAETQVRTAAEAGGSALPDIFFAPQPGLVRDLVGVIHPVPADLVNRATAEFDPYWFDLVTVDGSVLGVPAKGDVKSLVWYSPSAFAEAGYSIPETWDELMALQEQIKADGGTPWCIGIESGDATGWVFTDWMEDVMLRMHGPDVYDQWVANEIPFNDPRVREVAELVGEIWFDNANVAGGRDAIASTGFAAAGLGILDGSCYMHRQANFFAAQFRDADANMSFGDDGEVNVFYLPTMGDQFGRVLLTAGVYAVAFNDKPETLAALEYLTSAEYANNRVRADKGGFLSPNRNHDTSLYSDELDRILADILVTGNPVRFDGSDNMPGEVGAGSFWREGTNYVSGAIDVDRFLDNVQASWP
jgi:alpha-glucoside transport system substrate-binding protein